MKIKKLQLNFNNKIETENLIFAIIITIIGVMARTALFSYESGDYHQFLLPWYNQIVENGGIKAIGINIGDYMPTYIYILAFLSYLPIEPLTAIKIVSCIADLILAFFGYKIVTEVTQSHSKGLAAYGVLFFMPSVILNSAAWAQCDSIFTLFIVMSIYFLIKDKDWAAAICFSISFVFKIQAIFFAPVLLVLLLKKKIRWRTVLALPAVYLISILPAWIAGRDFIDLLTVYFRQPNQYNSLNMYIANAWGLLRDVESDILAKAGIFLAGGIVLIAIFILYRSKYKTNNSTIITLSGLFTLFVPFLLPHMHERYYYLATVIAAIFAIINIKTIWMFLIMEFCMFQAEAHNLFGKEAIDFNLSVLMVTFVLVWYFKILYDAIKNEKCKKSVPETEKD